MLRYDSDFVMDNDYVPGFNVGVFIKAAPGRTFSEFSQVIANEYDGDQDWVAVMAPDAELWPNMWCVPYRQGAKYHNKVVVRGSNPEDYHQMD